MNAKKAIEEQIEDILFLYAVDSAARMDHSMRSNVSWSGTAVKAAYRLGRKLNIHFDEITFGISLLDKALKQGRRDRVSAEYFQSSHRKANVKYLALHG